MRCTDMEFFNKLEEFTKAQQDVLKCPVMDTQCLKSVVYTQSNILEMIINVCREQQFRLNKLEQIKVTKEFTVEDKKEITDTIKFLIDSYIDNEDDLPVDLLDWKDCIHDYIPDYEGIISDRLMFHDDYVLDTVRNLIVGYVRKNIKNPKLATEILKSTNIDEEVH